MDEPFKTSELSGVFCYTVPMSPSHNDNPSGKAAVQENNNDREFLHGLIDEGADLEDTLGNFHGMILEEGEDPEEVLASAGVLK